MALKANRVGVRSDQVDAFGRVSSKSFFRKLLDRLPVWVDLPVWKGGTEQLLPVNDDEPETSPILADIDYPDILREDQYFTYRESPTEVDGTAHITGIRGNTLVWNQLVQNGNFVSNWIYSGATGSVANNVMTFTASQINGYARVNAKSGVSVLGHKYLGMIDLKGTSSFRALVYFDSSTGNVSRIDKTIGTSWETLSIIWTNNLGGNNWYPRIYDNRESGWDAIQARNAMIFDLTQMFGAGKEPTTVAEFTSLFPLPYYAYNTGTLLSFNGTGIKTVGFNQWDEEWINGSINVDTGVVASGTNVIAKNYIPVFPSTNYCATIRLRFFFYDTDKNFISYRDVNAGTVFTTPSNCHFILFTAFQAYGTTYNNDICINISSDKNGTYEPYTTQTTDLPISTFFPTGMKSAGTVYDELVPTKATTRIGAVDLGSLTWTYYTSGTYPIYYASVTDSKIGVADTYANMVCPMFTVSKSATRSNFANYANDLNMMIQTSYATLCVRCDAYTSASAFKTAMDGIYLFYELATEVVEPTMVFE